MRLRKLYERAVELNHQNIRDCIEDGAGKKIVDLGCDDGSITQKLCEGKGFSEIHGVDINENQLELAKKRGIITHATTLNNELPFENESFDVVISNQVIEHLYDSDLFLDEVYRVLKPGGYFVVSTENASSWCNIVASLLGWQIFSLTNFSKKALGLGNPLALHKKEKLETGKDGWLHVRIYNIRGLKEYLETVGFKVESIKGSGYFPLPAVLGNIDKTHAHFITIKARKP